MPDFADSHWRALASARKARSYFKMHCPALQMRLVPHDVPSSTFFQATGQSSTLMSALHVRQIV